MPGDRAYAGLAPPQPGAVAVGGSAAGSGYAGSAPRASCVVSLQDRGVPTIVPGPTQSPRAMSGAVSTSRRALGLLTSTVELENTRPWMRRVLLALCRRPRSLLRPSVSSAWPGVLAAVTGTDTVVG